mgnify:CR=1 FL=1
MVCHKAKNIKEKTGRMKLMIMMMMAMMAVMTMKAMMMSTAMMRIQTCVGIDDWRFNSDQKEL